MAHRKYGITLTEKLCSLCKITKPASAFGPDNRRPGGLKYACNECLRPTRRESYKRNPLTEEQRARKIAYANRSRGDRKAAGLCAFANCGKPIGATSDVYCDECRKKKSEAQNRFWRARAPILNQSRQYYAIMAQLECYDRYGGRKCACCGETELDFLSLHHINNDGYLHRKEERISHLGLWLKARNFPSGYRVLCMNCNHGSKRNGGVCPHERDSVLRLASAC